MTDPGQPVSVELQIDTSNAHAQISAVEARLASAQRMFGEVQVRGGGTATPINFGADGQVVTPPVHDWGRWNGRNALNVTDVATRAPYLAGGGASNPAAARAATARMAARAWRDSPQAFAERFAGTLDSSVADVARSTRGGMGSAVLQDLRERLGTGEVRRRLQVLNRVEGIRNAGSTGSLLGSTARGAAYARAMGIPIPRVGALLRVGGPLAAVAAATTLANNYGNPERARQQMDALHHGGQRGFVGEVARQMRDDIGSTARGIGEAFTGAIRGGFDTVENILSQGTTFAQNLFVGGLGVGTEGEQRRRIAAEERRQAIPAIRRVAERFASEEMQATLDSAAKQWGQRLAGAGLYESEQDTARQVRVMLEDHERYRAFRDQGIREGLARELGRQR